MRRISFIEGAQGGIGSWCGPIVRTCEPAGIAHATYAARRFSSNTTSADDVDGGATDAPPSGAQAKKRAPAPRFVEGKDPYELLGLGELRYAATDDDIKASYKRMVLVHHPDKHGGSDDAFKAIQAAYELLSDPRRRRIFDSSDEVDDSIPSPNDPGDFYTLYRPVFERLARFSVKQPVPSLGNAETSDEAVERFYAFWFVFESWREYSHADEYDPEQAESRDEKRWMERQNDKSRAKKKREEIERTARLVEQAHRLDPRVQAMKNREKAARQAEREARRAAQQAKERAETEAKRAAQEAAEAKAREEQAAREQHRRKLQSARDRLSTLAAPLLGKEFNADQLHLLLSYSPLGRLTPLLKSLDASPNVALLQAELQLVEAERAEATAKEEEERAARRGEEGPGKEWSADETNALVRALAKYPGGHTRRWEMICAFIGTGRSVKEVIAKTNALKTAAAAAAKPPEAKRAAVPAAVAAAPPIASAPSTNWDAINNATPTPTPAPAPAADEWSVEQQRALEAALRSCPASMGATRWDEIAKLVPGKTKKQCVDRFKLIAERLKAAKK